MKKLRNLLALMAIIIGIGSGYAFTTKPSKISTGIFILNPVTGNPIIPYIQLNPAEEGVSWFCLEQSSRYCTGTWYLDPSGNPIGQRISSKMGTYYQD